MSDHNPTDDSTRSYYEALAAMRKRLEAGEAVVYLGQRIVLPPEEDENG